MDVSLAELEKKVEAIVMPLLRSTRVTPRRIRVMLEEIMRVRAEMAMLASVKQGLKESAEGKRVYRGSFAKYAKKENPKLARDNTSELIITQALKSLPKVTSKQVGERPKCTRNTGTMLDDFAPLEASLERERRTGSTVITPEQLIIELDLTPRRVAAIERKSAVTLDWFRPAYSALRRHGLLRHHRSWAKWLIEYRRVRADRTAITIRELHSATGRWVRQASVLGELHVTERGRVIAKLLPSSPPPAKPFFSERKLTKTFKAAQRCLVGGPDSTRGISEERDQQVP